MTEYKHTGRKLNTGFLLIFVFLFLGCQGPKHQGYEMHAGRVLQFSFDPLYKYSTEDHFYLDGHLVIHRFEKGMLPFRNDTLFLPPKRMVYDKRTGIVKREGANNIMMAIMLNDGLNMLNSHLEKKERYKIVKGPELMVTGVITIEKESGGKIRMELPPGYPVHFKKYKK